MSASVLAREVIILAHFDSRKRSTQSTLLARWRRRCVGISPCLLRGTPKEEGSLQRQRERLLRGPKGGGGMTPKGENLFQH